MYGMDFDMGMGPDVSTGFDTFMIIFIIMFVLIFGIIAAFAIKALVQWNKNNNSPRLTVHAIVISKRTHIAHHHHGNHNGMSSHGGYTTKYFVAFQVDSGDRMELQMDGNEYGILVEGDNGYLTFQGTRYLGFQRI